MAQLCVYKNPNPRTRAQYPYLLDIQNDLLSELRTTIVIPLMPSSVASPITLSKLNPSFILGGERFTAITQDIAGIDRKQLGAHAYDLSSHRPEIIAAIDFVLSGI
jgi:toxin CcdB